MVFIWSDTAPSRPTWRGGEVNSTEKPLARTLLLLARYGESETSHRALPKLFQEVLAEMVGTAQSRVNFLHEQVSKARFIDYNGALKVNNSLFSVVLRD